MINIQEAGTPTTFTYTDPGSYTGANENNQPLAWRTGSLEFAGGLLQETALAAPRYVLKVQIWLMMEH